MQYFFLINFQLPPRLLRVAFVACLLVLIFSHFTDSAQGKQAVTETKTRARREHNRRSLCMRSRYSERNSAVDNQSKGAHCEFKFFAIINNAPQCKRFFENPSVTEIFSLAHESATKTVQLIIQFFIHMQPGQPVAP